MSCMTTSVPTSLNVDDIFPEVDLKAHFCTLRGLWVKRFKRGPLFTRTSLVRAANAVLDISAVSVC